MVKSKKLPTSTYIVFHLYMLLHVSSSNASDQNERQPYIVYMGDIRDESISLAATHHNLLSDAIGDVKLARNSKIYSYGRSFNGFAARLLPQEAEVLSRKKGVVSVFPSKVRKLLTTRSWDFVGMTEKVRRNHKRENDIVVGLLDTGIWVESPSFNDEGFGPPPTKWKGHCEKGLHFTGCNNKVIGARFFDIGKNVHPNMTTPADMEGHGTHTASVATGVSVRDASLYGIAKGTARGGVPSARIASYKVCWDFGCMETDILAAFDAAIADNVDIISVSIGGHARRFFEDPVAIGSFHALQKGILTVCAGGNDGPEFGTIENHVPWVLTVAASTLDGRFLTDVKLGNGDQLSGVAINTFSLKKKLYPLTNGALAQDINATYNGNISACDIRMLSPEKVEGEIVFCLGTNGETSILKLEGMGTIMTNDYDTDIPFITMMPSTYITVQDGYKIDNYINTTGSPKATIYKSRTSRTSAPAIASFSARGPMTFSPHILKPDITAPGVGILAAYTKYATITGDYDDNRVAEFNIVSGTSMACPHVSGAAAYVKSIHPTWSPAAIKSALMTTSTTMKIMPDGAQLAYGSGQLNPTKALNPGLVYDVDADSYISYLCKHGYNNISNIALMKGNVNKTCSNFPKAKGIDGLNYPSIHLQMNSSQSDIYAVFRRTVTNVCKHRGNYKVKVVAPKGLSVTVIPKTMVFRKKYHKRSFKVILNGRFLDEESWYMSGEVVWYDSKHVVKSPVLVYRPSPY